MYHCPHCAIEIEELNFLQDVTCYNTRYGKYILPGENDDIFNGEYEEDGEDCNDSESGDTSYECPSCNHSINLNDLCTDDEEENDDNKKSTEGFNWTATGEKHKGKVHSVNDNSKLELLCDSDIDRSDIPKHAKCHHCGYITITEFKDTLYTDDDEEPEPTCPKCFKSLTLNN